ncbi:MAG: hypothetical protein E6L09_11095 [Verrucomicrobia bacterium]|nr:MAG: hypothetical protein E6L09_11095 [Verrucomicrobiota bacterium]
MNDSRTPPLIPQPAPAGVPAAQGAPAPPVADPEDFAPIPNVFAAIESILRQRRRVMFQLRQPGSARLIAAMLFTSVVCSLIYGVIVGTFSGGVQFWAAPVKVAAGLLISALICLPSLYIFACLSGSQARLFEVVGLVAGLLLLMTVLLIGFAPVAWVFSQSTESVAAMGALHVAFWFISTCFGIRFLNAGFAQQSRSGDGLKVWTVIFLLVMAQMTAALRPIVGTADTFLPTEKKFFVTHWLDTLKRAR